jgi:hypothetical protein
LAAAHPCCLSRVGRPDVRREQVFRNDPLSGPTHTRERCTRIGMVLTWAAG